MEYTLYKPSKPSNGLYRFIKKMGIILTPVVSIWTIWEKLPFNWEEFYSMHVSGQAPEYFTYHVKKGDTYNAIAFRYGMTLSEMKALNEEIKDPSLIYADITTLTVIDRREKVNSTNFGFGDIFSFLFSRSPQLQ